MPAQENNFNFEFPAAAVDKCLIAYSSATQPHLLGAPIILDGETSDGALPIVLSRSMMHVAQRSLDQAFSAQENPSQPPPAEPNVLPATVFRSCDPNSHVAVDAAVRHLAHQFKANVIILDPEDLAAGRKGVLGAGEHDYRIGHGVANHHLQT